MKWLSGLASSSSHHSIAARFRRKRFRLFKKLVERIEKPSLRILDVGGWEIFWEIMGFADTPHQIVLLNLEQYHPRHPNITSLVGDGRDMSAFGDKSFDIVFSNSVIEHLYTLDQQRRMAQEVQRVGEHYFIQTPNIYFPLEPHFLTPFFQWFPRRTKIWLHQHFHLGFYPKAGTRENAERLINEIRLLTPSEFRALFPDATMNREKVLLLTKSLIAVA